MAAAPGVTTQAPVPEHPPPLQPPKIEPEAALAVRVTPLPLAKLPEQLAPQAIPAGLLVTVPLPAPILSTARGTGVIAHAVFE